MQTPQQPVQTVDRRRGVGADLFRERNAALVAEQTVVALDVDDHGVDFGRVEQAEEIAPIIAAADGEVRHVRRADGIGLQAEVEPRLAQIELGASVARREHLQGALAWAVLQLIRTVGVGVQHQVAKRDTRAGHGPARRRVGDSTVPPGLQLDTHHVLADIGGLRAEIAVSAQTE